MQADGLTPADQELESALRGLTPAAVHIDPVAAAYAAGRQTLQRQLRFWRSAAALLLLTGIGPWLIPGRDGSNLPSQTRTVSASHIAVSSEAPPQSLVALQRAVLHDGVRDLPLTELPAVSTVRAVRSHDLF